MKKLLTLFLAAACFTASAQSDIDYPYNPDFENDGFVGIEDVLELLSVYGAPFNPEQLMLDGASLTEIIESLQTQIDSLASFTNEGFGALVLNDSLLTEYLVGVAAASEEGDSTLAAWVMQLSEVVEQQQAQLDSLPVLNQGYAFGETERIQLHELQWVEAADYGLLAQLHFENDGLLRIATTSGQVKCILIPDSTEYSEFHNEAEAEANFIESFFEHDFGPLTLPVRNDEQMVFYANGNIDDGSNYPGSLYLHWTPLIASELFEVTDGTEDDLGPCQGEFTVNYHGYDYELVEIGDQCWFAEDLVSQSFSDDSPITFVGEQEYDATYPSGPVFAQCEIAGNGSFGLLYNWPAISDDRGLCPSGWHTSTKQEWESLVNFIETNFLVTTQGALKSKTDWVNAGADHLGFNAKPSGYYGGGYCYGGWPPNSLGLWTASEIDANGDIGTYRFTDNGPLEYTADCSQGFCVAVRCIKD